MRCWMDKGLRNVDNSYLYTSGNDMLASSPLKFILVNLTVPSIDAALLFVGLDSTRIMLYQWHNQTGITLVGQKIHPEGWHSVIK